MARKFIINADDYGYTVAISKTILDFFHNKYCDTASAMVNVQEYKVSYDLAFEAGVLDRIGLHINLTKGMPITNKMSRCKTFCKSGKFGVYKANKTKRFILSIEEKKIVEDEIRAQMERYLNLGYKGMMVDSHQGIHMDPSIYSIVLNLCKEYGFKKLRRSPNIKTDFVRTLYHRPFQMALERSKLISTDYMGNINEYKCFGTKIDPEKSIEIMCHPQEKDGILYIDETSNYLLDDYLEIVLNT